MCDLRFDGCCRPKKPHRRDGRCGRSRAAVGVAGRGPATRCDYSASLLAGMFQVTVTPAPAAPVAVCGVYVYSYLAKFSATDSVCRSSLPLPEVEMEETMTSYSLSLMY